MPVVTMVTAKCSTVVSKIHTFKIAIHLRKNWNLVFQ